MMMQIKLHFQWVGSKALSLDEFVAAFHLLHPEFGDLLHFVGRNSPEAVIHHGRHLFSSSCPQ